MSKKLASGTELGCGGWDLGTDPGGWRTAGKRWKNREVLGGLVFHPDNYWKYGCWSWCFKFLTFILLYLFQMVLTLLSANQKKKKKKQSGLWMEHGKSRWAVFMMSLFRLMMCQSQPCEKWPETWTWIRHVSWWPNKSCLSWFGESNDDCWVFQRMCPLAGYCTYYSSQPFNDFSEGDPAIWLVTPYSRVGINHRLLAARLRVSSEPFVA